jgi:hypothetical protein
MHLHHDKEYTRRIDMPGSKKKTTTPALKAEEKVRETKRLQSSDKAMKEGHNTSNGAFIHSNSNRGK